MKGAHPVTHPLPLERRLGDWMRARLPEALAEFVMFGLKMGWACLFGGLLLAAMIVTAVIWQDSWPLARYDALLAFALLLQVLFLAFGFESLAEARVILLFHLTGTAMEIFKVHAGSWSYPGAAQVAVAGVPLYSGFMYASVGSFMARAIRLFDMQFAPFPPFGWHLALAVAAYVNFFAHHFVWDARLLLFAATVALYARTRVWFRIGETWRWMPLPVAAFLSSLFLWIAENVGTMTGTWLYAGQGALEMVSFSKMGSWYLLLYVAFATVTLVVREPLRPIPFAPRAPRSPEGSRRGPGRSSHRFPAPGP